MRECPTGNLIEFQFERILAHYMFSLWQEVRVSNGLLIGEECLFPVAIQYDPVNHVINDWTRGDWASGIDLILADGEFHLYVAELKTGIQRRIDFLESLSQAYQGAYRLSKTDPRVLQDAFRMSIRSIYGLPETSKYLVPNRIDVFRMHQDFYGLSEPLSSDDIDLDDLSLVIMLNPGHRFPRHCLEDSGMTVGEIREALSGDPRGTTALKRLQEIPDGYVLPVYLAEFDMKLGAMTR